MLSSIARVSTDSPARYAKQLVSHLGRKTGAVELPDGAFELRLSAGVGVVRVEGGLLIMEATGADDDALASVEDVLARHLVRFGARQELQVTWEPALTEPADQ
jgi:hypothetical protein